MRALALLLLLVLPAAAAGPRPSFVAQWKGDQELEFKAKESRFFDSVPLAKVVEYLEAHYPTLAFAPTEEGFVAQGPHEALKRVKARICRLSARDLPEPPPPPWSVDGVWLGMARRQVIETLGEPARVVKVDGGLEFSYPDQTVYLNTYIGVYAVSGRAVTYQGRVLAKVGAVWREPEGDFRLSQLRDASYLSSDD
ncbi:MAG: hypothetical protein KC910_31485, partial [Candidatus Eremiobacteraeota bacterium]|nr:hypothetical protein [Candidatus Eremiobacteraeota bacterium]